MLSHEYKRTSFQLSLIGGDDVVRSFNDFMQYLYSMGMETQQQLDPVKWMNLWGFFSCKSGRTLAIGHEVNTGGHASESD